MSKSLGTIIFDEEIIILKYYDGYSQKFKILTSPKYTVGTEFFDYGGNRYFLVEE